MRITWYSSPGDITGYKLQVFPEIAGSKKQELYIGPTFTMANVRDLSPETEYEISLFALKGLTPSQPQVVNEKTQPVKVSTGKMLTSFVHASRPCLHLILRCVLVDLVTSRQGRHIPMYIWCFNPSLLFRFWPFLA